MKNNHNLIWIDLEMTGLDPEANRIIEIATIVTDPHLNIIGEGPVFAVSQPKAELDAMDSWNTRQHGQSGLVARVLESTVDEKQAEQETVNFLKQFVDKGKSPMCGNSVCQDRRFLYKYMPELAAFFHYRNLDVSTLKELAIRWKPELLNGVNKQSKHLALDDIKDSIAELVYYRQHFINLPEVTP
ncbi:oligoribonuclease [Legionella lytica]|uniref:Oligoribonuclease n=1 Tax=Legionella lytica TaxID=96232 RepID=A0ABY4Y9G6_9GAMM|nr:oligoribonuclease [Legionella lytica]USQ14274.1 oligoribonuclease [Legionella lytica]